MRVRPVPGNPNWPGSLCKDCPEPPSFRWIPITAAWRKFLSKRARRSTSTTPIRSIGNCSTSTSSAIAAGRAFDEPVYSFADYARTAETRRIEPADFLIVEGLFVLYWPELRAMLDTKVYVQTDAEVCFQRRLARDVAERGRTPESVREQYERTVRPSAEWFVYPTRNTPTS